MAIEKPSDLEPGQAGYRVNTPPIPHPSALGDLYEACRDVLQGLELTGAHGSHWATVLRSAIRKAGGVA